jgi:glycosyltransferase involved in cell wall biosynthesis
MIKREFLMPILTLKSNGGGIVAFELARSIVKRGRDVTILSSSYYGVEAVRLPENVGIKFLIVPSIFGKKISIALLLIYGFYYSIKYKPNLIYTHIATSLIPNFSGQKAVWLAQDIEYRFYGGKAKSIFKIVFKKIASNANLLVTSDYLGRFFRRIGSRIIYVKNIGVSRKIFGELSISASALRENDILIIAKYGAHKRGIESKILAKYFSAQGLKVTLINQMSGDVMPNDNLKLMSAVSHGQMLQLLLTSKIFINLSRFEGFGLVPLEALYAGCMVVTTTIPSILNYESPQLKILKGHKSLIDEAAEAVGYFINLPQNIFDKNTLSGNSFLEDWAFNASETLLRLEIMGHAD